MLGDQFMRPVEDSVGSSAFHHVESVGESLLDGLGY